MDLADSVLPSAKYSEMDFSISFSFFFFHVIIRSLYSLAQICAT